MFDKFTLSQNVIVSRIREKDIRYAGSWVEGKTKFVEQYLVERLNEDKHSTKNEKNRLQIVDVQYLPSDVVRVRLLKDYSA